LHAFLQQLAVSQHAAQREAWAGIGVERLAFGSILVISFQSSRAHQRAETAADFDVLFRLEVTQDSVKRRGVEILEGFIAEPERAFAVVLVRYRIELGHPAGDLLYEH